MDGINFNSNIDYNQDTEFNEALRKHGIIPEKPQEERPPTPIFEGPHDDNIEKVMDAIFKSGDFNDDAVPRQMLEEYMEKRMEDAKKKKANARFGSVIELSSKADYKREVTDASKEPSPAEDEYKGTSVICVMYQPYLQSCEILMPIIDQMAKKYPATKFVKVIATRAVENYPDKNCPTVLCYRDGTVVGNIVGLASKTKDGQPVTFADIETLLYSFRAIDPLAAVIEPPKSNNDNENKQKNSDRSDSESEEEEEVKQKKGSIFRRSEKKVNDDSDSDFDI